MSTSAKEIQAPINMELYRDKTILLHVHPVTDEMILEFPMPEGGVAEPKIGNDGKAYYLPMTASQKAYHVFWQDGTKERIEGVLEAGVGRRKTMTYLLQLRARHVRQVTGFNYQVISTTSLAEFGHLRTYNKKFIRPLGK